MGKTHANSTGGGPPLELPIDDLDEKMLEIIKTVSVEGHAVAESMVEFEFDKNESKATKPEPDILNLPSAGETLTPISNITKCSRKKSIKKKKALLNSSEALTSYQENLEKTSAYEQQYREKKLCLIERQVAAQERLASAQERNAIAQEELKEAISQLTEIARELI